MTQQCSKFAFVTFHIISFGLEIDGGRRGLYYLFSLPATARAPLTPAMESARNNTQKLVTLHVDDALFEAIETARGHTNRSQWIRSAIAEKSEREGVPVPLAAIYAPDRGRKNGKKWSTPLSTNLQPNNPTIT